MPGQRDLGRQEDLVRATPTVLAGLTETADVDWRERERQFGRWQGFTPQEWFDLATAAGIRPGRGRDRHAAAWLWAELTGLDWRTALVLGGVASDSDRAVHRRFRRQLLYELEPVLLAHGEDLCARQPSGVVVACRSARLPRAVVVAEPSCITCPRAGSSTGIVCERATSKAWA